MTTYIVQAIYGNQFEDLYVEARSPEQAVAKARKLTSLRSRWTRFVL